MLAKVIPKAEPYDPRLDDFIQFLHQHFRDITQASKGRNKWYREPGYALASVKLPSVGHDFEPTSFASMAVSSSSLCELC